MGGGRPVAGTLGDEYPMTQVCRATPASCIRAGGGCLAVPTARPAGLAHASLTAARAGGGGVFDGLWRHPLGLEFFREPDSQLGLLQAGLSMGAMAVQPDGGGRGVGDYGVGLA
jgi:hypothetical protein